MAMRRVAAVRQTITNVEGVIKEAVHVKIHPRPRNLAESREVLRILQRYGEVAVYKHLKYESVAPAHNTAIAIYESVAAAQKLINASPIRFKLQDGKLYPNPLQENPIDFNKAEERTEAETASTGEDGHTLENQAIDDEWHITSSAGRVKDTAFQGLGGSTKWGRTLFNIDSELPSSPADLSSVPPSKNFTPDPPLSGAPRLSAQIPVPPPAPTSKPPPPPSPVEYQLTITHSNMNHAGYIQRQGYYGGFSLDTKSIMAEDLEGRVPTQGLIDCQIRRMEAPARIVARWKQRAAARSITLRELWENGKKERGE